MASKLLRSIAWCAALTGAAVILPPATYAQMAPGGAGAGFLGRTPTPGPQNVAPPPALPGAASRRSTPAPADKTPSDMSPNDALFDAINRGDVAAARDALSRGAELNAQNLLGMTPLELAVDLGRNDIAFLLLSMRGSGSGGGASPGTAQAASLPASGKPPGKSAGRHPAAAARQSVRVVAEAPPDRPRLFAHDGGAPIPSIGFLGFDPQRAAP